jgi:hypothetical protein
VFQRNSKCQLAGMAIILAASLSPVVTAQAQAPAKPVDAAKFIPNPAHRALFCGVDGGEGSRVYSEAVSKAITKLIKTGSAKTPAQAIDQLKEALCKPGAAQAPATQT